MGLKERMAERGISVKDLSIEEGVTRFAVSHFIHGRRYKAGKTNCRKIAAYLIEKGLMKARKKRKVIEGNRVAGWVLKSISNDLEKACQE